MNPQPPFEKILIANRGEIAIRLARACRELGIRSVAVYSEVDAGALHTRAADEAVLLGPAAPRESYLNIERILAAAKQSGAQAVHPGYGFLSENAAFASAVEQAGLTFIGPPAAAIRAMGDKAESKIAMRAASVPTVPGLEGLETLSDYTNAADKIGYPVLVKAAAGGGGKGMRVMRAPDEMAPALEAARREALNSFGDERLLLEKYLDQAHHIEFQVFGDRHGHLVHLFERECSTQRRHQKIIEESPSPLMDADLRARMGAAAVAAARAVGYFNAGTVEFIVDPRSREFFFLEMNTRLQVEHPITELVTGLDLAHWQIRIAAGEHFPYTQEQLSQRGHAIECRIYAEDPANGFLPSTGSILRLVEPRGPGLRLDSGVAEGSAVTHYYDPLLAKLIAHAETRPEAIRRMLGALDEMSLHGVITNLDFLKDVLAHADFQAGLVDTRWVERVFGEWNLPGEIPLEALIAAALAEGQPAQNAAPAAGLAEKDPYSPWKRGGGFRLG